MNENTWPACRNCTSTNNPCRCPGGRPRYSWGTVPDVNPASEPRTVAAVVKPEDIAEMRARADLADNAIIKLRERLDDQLINRRMDVERMEKLERHLGAINDAFLNLQAYVGQQANRRSKPRRAPAASPSRKARSRTKAPRKAGKPGASSKPRRRAGRRLSRVAKTKVR